MTATKKSLRFLTVLALIFAMILSFASISTSAAGAETWYVTDDYIFENNFTIRGYNLTPVKTMGASGTLHILFELNSLLDTGTNPNDLVYTYQIRSASGTVLLGGTEKFSSTNDGLPFAVFTQINVKQGQKVQIYISVYDIVTGVYRTASVGYGHWLDA